MDLELYQQETAFIAQEQSSLLDEAAVRLSQGELLSRLEMNGVLHALQILIENAIGKAKQILHAQGRQVPVSAYDSFSALASNGTVSSDKVEQWRAIVGLRNRIVHDYMNIDFGLIRQLVLNRQYQFVTDFLLMPVMSIAPLVKP
jgi:uncharacterized protein YutE (UPF0331/DUF86 family)